jgi:hypothetical protein
MSENGEEAKSPPAPRGFAKTFAQLVLICLATLIFVCDALPAVEARLQISVAPGSGPVASLHGLLQDYFWPGTIVLHGGLAALWIACGPGRYSLRILTAILSMSARAVWAWQLYGSARADQSLGEPFSVSGLPILMFTIAWMTSLLHRGDRVKQDGPSAKYEHKLQIVDLIAWTASTALLLGPVLTFSKALNPSVLSDRAYYYASPIAAWIGMTCFSAFILKEWLRPTSFGQRIGRILAGLLALFIVSALLIVGARLLADWGPEDMAFYILTPLIPSMFTWCCATGWALRELGVRLEKRKSPTLPRA